MQGKRLLANMDACKIELKYELNKLFNMFDQAIKKTNWIMSQINPIARRNGQEAINLQGCFAENVFREFGSSAKNGKNGRLILTVKGYIILFKKLDTKGLPMNIRTENTKKINNQAIQLSLFSDNENSEAPILYFGYQKNKLGEYVDPRIVYIDEERVRFTIDAQQAGYIPNLFSTYSDDPIDNEKAAPVLKNKIKSKFKGN
jgi:hypothetical protein